MILIRRRGRLACKGGGEYGMRLYADFFLGISRTFVRPDAGLIFQVIRAPEAKIIFPVVR